MRNGALVALTLAALGCGSAHGGLDGGNSDGNGSANSALARRICDGSSSIRLAIGFGGGGQVLPFTSVLYELGSDFLYVDGSCHYWTQEPLSLADEYYAWRPYREGVLTAAQEREVHDVVGYDDFAGEVCADTRVPDASSGFLWEGRVAYSCGNWSIPADWPLRSELYEAGTSVTGPMRIQVGKAAIGENQVVYEWPLDASLERYSIEYGETRSFLVDDAAAVTALRALRRQAITDAAAAPGYFTGVIAIGPREGNESYVLSLRDELPFVDAQGKWLPAPATSGARRFDGRQGNSLAQSARRDQRLAG